VQEANQLFAVLEKIKSASGRNQKLALLELLKENDFAKFYFTTVFNPYLTYGVVPRGEQAPSEEPPPDPLALRWLRMTLNRREVTGQKALAFLEGTYCTNSTVWNYWIRLMWERNLRIGISISSINKVFSGLIPQFELQLCSAITDQQLEDDWIIEPKFDGLRCLFMTDSAGECNVGLSRNGKELFNIDHIKKEITSLNLPNVVFDGELYGEDWNITASVVRASVTEKNDERIKFYWFDLIPKEEWDAQKGESLLTIRKLRMKSALKLEPKHLVLVDYQEVKDVAQAWQLAESLKKQGYEGAVAKKLDGIYEFGRSSNWLKLKFVETLDLPVVGFYLGTGKNAERLGGLIVETETGVKVQVGGGYSDQQRDEFWEKRESFIGKIIEVKCQEKTKDGSLRFPVFLRVREDKC